MSVFGRLSIRLKMAMGPLAIFLVMAVSTGDITLLMADNEKDLIGLRDGLIRATSRSADLMNNFEEQNGRFYRLTTVAANETDKAKIERMSAEVLAGADALDKKFPEAKEAFLAAGIAENDIQEVLATYAAYRKAMRSVIDMVSADVGTALMLMGGVDRSAEKFNDLFVAIDSDLASRRDRSFNEIIDQGHQTLLTGYYALAASLLITLGVLWVMARIIAAPIVSMTEAMNRAADGDVKSPTPSQDRQDEIGQMAHALERFKQGAVASLRSSLSIDILTSNVMIADEAGNIVVVSESVRNMLRRAQDDIRKELPNFDVEKVLNSNIDIFHKNPAHQKNLLGRLTTTHKASITLGGRTFNLIANPLTTKSGERLGTSVEWADVTQELAIEGEIQGIVSGAVAGDFSRRLDLTGKSGFMLQLSEGMNGLLTTVAKALDDVSEVVGALADGKLGARMSTEYSGVLAQLGTDINAMGTRLSEIVGGITEGSETIASAASEISQATDDLAARTEQQAANLEETAAAMEEMTATVQKNADNAVQANELVEEARSRAATGGEIVDKAVSAVDSIQKSSSEMAEIVNLIDDIAFQTNLLALNAAVEAARAGDAGKGFAVVATEVRSLAQRSGEAAKNIKDLIKTSNNHVDAGVRLVNETGDALKGIIQSVSQIATIMQDVTSASREQATGLGEVNSAVSQMDEMTQQNAAMVEQTQAAAKSLADEAAHLSERVGFFDVSGAQALTPPPAKMASLPAAKAKAAPAAIRPKAAAPVVRPKAPVAAPARKVLPKPAPRKPAAAGTAPDDDWKEF